MRINHITILVADRLKSAQFYSQVLGLEIVEKGKSRWIKIGDQYVHLAQYSDQPIINNFSHFCIEVPNVIEYSQNLITKGIQVFDLNSRIEKTNVNQNLDQQGRQYFVHDPDLNLIEICDSNNEYFK